MVKPSATVDFPTFDWFWSDGVRVACPHGIDSFIAGKEYSHGGLSVQECVVPQLAVRHGKGAGVSATIGQVRWSGLRCRITVVGTSPGCSVDLRDSPADSATSLSGAKPVGQDGGVSLVVGDDSREGSGTTLVLLDAKGVVIARLPLAVGG